MTSCNARWETILSVDKTMPLIFLSQFTIEYRKTTMLVNVGCLTLHKINILQTKKVFSHELVLTKSSRYHA